jgi:hypothetical protein
MPGSWSTGSLPRRPGAYFNFKAQPAVLVPPAVGAVVAVPFTTNWGPLESAVALNSFSDYVAIFGNDVDQPGYRAVRQVFRGEAVRGRRGAGQVIAYRMGGTSAAKATVNLINTATNPGLRVDAIYQGARGNNLRVTIQTDPVDATKKDLIVLDGLTEVERFVYNPVGATALAALATQINGISDWVTVTVLTDGVALNSVASVPLAGGDSGTTLVAQDWTDMMAALETFRYGYLVPFDLTDGSILTSVKTWVQNANTKGRRFFLVVGGALNETVSTAITRSGTLNDPDIVNVGVGSVRDDEMLDSNGNPVILSTSQFAPRIAGIMSALGENRSLTGARIGGVTHLNGATESGIDAAYDGGVLVLSRDSDPDAPVHVEKGISTYTQTASSDRPYEIFKNPKFVRTMHDLQTEISEYVASNVIGQLPVNSRTRSGIVAYVSTLLQAREDNEAVQSGWTVAVSAEPPPSDDDEFVALDLNLGFGRSTEQVLLNVGVR